MCNSKHQITPPTEKFSVVACLKQIQTGTSTKSSIILSYLIFKLSLKRDCLQQEIVAEKGIFAFQNN